VQILTAAIQLEAMANRSISLSIKLRPADWELLQRAGQKLWPGAPVSRSSLVLALAKLQAEMVLHGADRQKESPRRVSHAINKAVALRATQLDEEEERNKRLK
jgi:hypothetical protein